MSLPILIVDDHLPLAEAIQKLLANQGLEAETSGDGVDALTKLTRSDYRLLIVDLHLPKLSGIEIVRKLRATDRGKRLPIIIISGVYKGEDYRKKAREVFQVNHYLEKPFTQDALLAAVKASLPAPRQALPPAEPAPVEPARRVPGVAASERSPAPPPEVGGPFTPLAIRPFPPKAPAPVAQHHGPNPAQAPASVAEIKPSPALRGDFKAFPLDRLLLEARGKKITGVLFAKKSDDDRQLVFVSGLPIAIGAKKVEVSYGAYLFHQGKISLMEYQVYQQRTDDDARDELFVKMGCMPADDHYALWREYLEEAIIEMFGWDQAEFIFRVWPTLPEGAPAPSVNLAHIIHQGFKRKVAAARIEKLQRSIAGRFPALAPAFHHHRMHLGADEFDEAFLAAVDGTRPLDELLPANPEDLEDTLRGLAAFMALGMVELRNQPGPGRVEPPFPIRQGAAPEAPAPAPKPGPAKPAPVAAAPAPTPAPAAAGAPAAVSPLPPAPAEPAPVALEAGEGEGFEDLLDDLGAELNSVVDDLKQTGPSAPPPQPDAADLQRKLEDDLIAFLDKIRNKSYYEIFNMKPTSFDFTRIRDDYFKLTKQFSPEKYMMCSGDILAKAEDVLGLLATAYNTLTNVVSKEKYDEMLGQTTGPAGIPHAKDHDKIQAEVAFQSGMAFLEMGDWDGAEKSLGEAASLAPANAEIVAHYSYAVYNKNRKSKTVQKKAQDLIARSLKLNPKCASAYAYRGAILLDDDKVSLAEADFKKAVSINPKYRFAQKGLKKIEAKRQDEKKGLIGRLMK